MANAGKDLFDAINKASDEMPKRSRKPSVIQGLTGKELKYKKKLDAIATLLAPLHVVNLPNGEAKVINLIEDETYRQQLQDKLMEISMKFINLA